jgi:hypothetical protein
LTKRLRGKFIIILPFLLPHSLSIYSALSLRLFGADFTTVGKEAEAGFLQKQASN